MNHERIKKAAAALGRKGGSAKGGAKAAAARQNGAAGGYPHVAHDPEHGWTSRITTRDRATATAHQYQQAYPGRTAQVYRVTGRKLLLVH